ncbi:hypothetical protein [Reticulibacter mediterranei]|nr:hypothetical protein [Reticulibacter mediterranei]
MTNGGQAEAGEDLEQLAAPLVAIGRVLPDLLHLLTKEELSVPVEAS